MLHTFTKLLKICALAVFILLGVTLSVSNRASIDLSFYPLPYVLTMPVFLFAIVVFMAGILLGWVVARLATFGIRRARKNADKRIAALENELTALRSEQLIKPTLLPPR